VVTQVVRSIFLGVSYAHVPRGGTPASPKFSRPLYIRRNGSTSATKSCIVTQIDQRRSVHKGPCRVPNILEDSYLRPKVFDPERQNLNSRLVTNILARAIEVVDHVKIFISSDQLSLITIQNLVSGGTSEIFFSFCEGRMCTLWDA